MIGRSLFFARMFNPLIALLRPVSPLAPAANWPAAVPEGGAGFQLDHFYLLHLADGDQHRGGCAADPAGLSQRRPRPPALGVDGDAQNPLSGGAAGGAYRRAPLHRHRPRLVIVAAEMLTGGLGIGFWIWNEWNNLNVENIIIAIVIIGVVGLLLEQGLMLLARRFSWQEK